MRLSDPEYEFIKESVVDLFKVYNISGFPLNPFELAGKMNIRCIPYRDLSKKVRTEALEYSEDGCSLEKLNCEWVIYYNNDFSRGTINNILMHEIAHYWLGHTGAKENEEREESEASFFAKYALTPPIIANRLLNSFEDRDFKDRFELSWAGAKGAREYYESWLNCSRIELTGYEIDLLTLNGLE